MKNRTATSETLAASNASRREFLAASGLGPLCCVSQPIREGSWSIADDRLRIDLNRDPALLKLGEARTIVDVGRKVNIIVVQREKGRWAAVDRTCTHGGAMCAYQKRTNTLRCTSLNHAEYNLEGRLLHGRTHGDLRSYAVTRHEDWLDVALGAKP